jgi:hypothetical protein
MPGTRNTVICRASCDPSGTNEALQKHSSIVAGGPGRSTNPSYSARGRDSLAGIA